MPIITPSLNEINIAMRTVMVDVLKPYKADTAIILEGEDLAPKLNKILVLVAFRPVGVTGAEMGGKLGNVRRVGNFLMTLSIRKSDNPQLTKAWNIADALCDKFRMLDIQTASGGSLYAGEPYTTNAGVTPDERISLLVTVPWTAWTGGVGD